MDLGKNIRTIREQKGLKQKEVANELKIGYTNYNKIENGIREITVAELKKIAMLFDMTVDQVLNFDGELPQEVTVEDKTEREQFKMFNELDEDDKKTVFKIIDTMLTKKKFKDFFNKNIAAL